MVPRPWITPATSRSALLSSLYANTGNSPAPGYVRDSGGGGGEWKHRSAHAAGWVLG
eukprot:CAMPEP_0170135814 /NCGR_PEP_ID=MMETSP0033_2-20121228/2709_1 /TAXON_ID=195969 /ORGANISM="Dolichomastix tenuilepis, Strain CCMP3274" /LENGTH=56 /DNA_ID=CAMNT_0010371431 /DNA_START=718 /DNA_END=888 /DNA_ORIENTATION=+